jgi:hypothetical protein
VPADLAAGLAGRTSTRDLLPLKDFPGQLAAVIGREFLVPDDSELNDEDLLKEAVHLSSDDRFRRKRAAYWRWQNEFLRDATILDKSAIDDAVQEMNDLIADERAEVRRSRIKLGASFSFAVGAACVGMIATPMAPVALAGAFLSIGAWAIDHIPDSGAEPKPAAMCVSVKRHFGWGKQG